MDNAQSDLVEWYKLETEFFPDHVRHTRYLGEARNRDKKEKEDWSNCGELGSGGFGVVHKQIRKTTGRYRAVKTIDKRPPLRLDYSRELLVMAILAKVGVPFRRGFTPTYYPCRTFSLCSNPQLFSVHRSLWNSWDGSRSPRLFTLQWNILRKATLPCISVLHYYKKPFRIFQSRSSRVLQ